MPIPSLSPKPLEKRNSPYLNRFLQPDTVIPDLSNPQSWNRYSYVVNTPINASDPSGHKCVGEVDECLSDPVKGASKQTVKTSDRAEELKDYGYSAEELIAMIFQRESFSAWREDEDRRWFSGEVGDPAEIFEEAATRWFWSWIKDAGVEKIYGKTYTIADRDAMVFNWLYEGMQSEDNVNQEILDGYYADLKPEFLDIAHEVLNPTNKERMIGDGMWSWANAYLYNQEGADYLSAHHLYKFGDGPTSWFIFDADTVRFVADKKKKE